AQRSELYRIKDRSSLHPAVGESRGDHVERHAFRGGLEHGYPPERARVVGIDQRGRMKQRRVIPHDDVAYAVFDAQPILGLRRVRGELVEEIESLVVWHADDTE